MSKTRPPAATTTTPQKTNEQAIHDCDWIALYGWEWWKKVIADVEARTNRTQSKSNTAREDN